MQNWHVWPCVVVSPEVPARGTTPLSTWGMRIRGSSHIFHQKMNLKIKKGWCDLMLHLDADQDAPVPDHLDEGYAVIRVLVERLMEEDDPSDAAVDALVRTEENLPELSAVLLRVLHADLGQTLGHAACDEHMLYGTLVWSLWSALWWHTCAPKLDRESATDPQTRPQPGCPSLEKLCVEQSHAAPSSEPRRVWGSGASSWVSDCPLAYSLWLEMWPHDCIIHTTTTLNLILFIHEAC